MARIMVVDDAKIMRTVIKKYLEKAGHEVVFEAENGQNAIKGYMDCKPDLVTMDITMPDMSGISVLEKIMALDPKARVIMMSSHSQKDIIMQALAAGAKHFILKPPVEKLTIEVVNEVLMIK